MRRNRIAAILVCLIMLSGAFYGCVDNQTKYKLEFETFGGQAIESVRYKAGESLDLPDAEWPHNKFIGWFTDIDATEEFLDTKMPSKDLTLYAGFVPLKSYVVSFKSNGGEAVSDIIVEEGASIAPPPPPQYSGRAFAGWYTDANLTNEFHFGTVTSDLMLYAKWNITTIQIVINFYANGRLVASVEIEDGGVVSAAGIIDGAEYIRTDWKDENGNVFNFETSITGIEKLDLFATYQSKALTIVNNTVTNYTGTNKDAVVVVPTNVTAISANAFANKKTIKEVYIDGDVVSVGKAAFSGCTALTAVYGTEKIETVGENAFYNCSNLTAIDLSAATIIENGAFNNCANLKTVAFGANLTEIKQKAFAGCKTLGEVVLGDKVQAIGSYAFQNCSALKEFVLPKALENLETGVFEGCSALKAVSIADGNTNFQQDELCVYSDNWTKLVYYNSQNASLATFEIPDGVLSVEKSAFTANTNIKNIILPSSLTSNGSFDILGGLTALTTVTIAEFGNIPFLAHLYGARNGTENGTNSIKVPANLKNVVIESGSAIPAYAFYGCKNLTAVEGLEDATSIGDYAFAYTTFISEFTVGASLREIGSGAFQSCNVTAFDVKSGNQHFAAGAAKNYLYNKTDKALIKVLATDNADKIDIETLAVGITSIADYAFENCTFMEIKVSPSVAYIGKGAFYGCTRLENLVTPLTGLTAEQDFNYLFAASNYSLKNLTVIGNLTTIPSLAFSGSKIINLTLPSTVRTIGDRAFLDSVLTTLSGTDSVETIAEYAFFNCTNLTTVSFPKLVSIGAYAFRDGVIKEFTIAKTLRTVGVGAFMGCGIESLIFEGGAAQSTLRNIEETAFQSINITGALVLPATVTNIGNNSFAFTSMTSLSFAGTKSSSLVIDSYAFSRCSKLVSVDFSGTNLKTIGASAFFVASALEEVILPNSLTSIESFAFIECRSLANIELPDSITNVGQRILDFTKWAENYGGSEDYSGVMYNGQAAISYKGAIEEGSKVTFESEVNGKTIRIIADSFFQSGHFHAANVRELEIPSSYTHIGRYSFSNCKNIEKVTIGSVGQQSQLVQIGYNAFANCTAMTEFILHKDITHANQAPVLKKETWETGKIFTFSMAVFGEDGSSTIVALNVKLYVPQQSLEYYKVAWNEYSDKFRAIEP